MVRLSKASRIATTLHYDHCTTSKLPAARKNRDPCIYAQAAVEVIAARRAMECADKARPHLPLECLLKSCSAQSATCLAGDTRQRSAATPHVEKPIRKTAVKSLPFFAKVSHRWWWWRPINLDGGAHGAPKRLPQTPNTARTLRQQDTLRGSDLGVHASRSTDLS